MEPTSEAIAPEPQRRTDVPSQAPAPAPTLGPEEPDLPAMPMRPQRERIIGALGFVSVTLAFCYAIVNGRLDDLTNNLSVVVPLGGLLAMGSVTLLLPIPIVAEAVGVGKKWGEKVRRGRSYAAILAKNGNMDLTPIKGPVVHTKNPPALYEPTVPTRVLVTKTIRRGSYLTIFNHSNPQPVNGQSIKGYTAEHLHNLVGGLLTSAVDRSWALGVGLVAPNRKRILLMAGVALLAYFLFQWYQGRYA